MFELKELIGKIGESSTNLSDVEICEIDFIDDNFVEFVMGDNSYLAKIYINHVNDDDCEYEQITINELYIILCVNEKYISAQVLIIEDFSFVIDAIENLLSSDLTCKRRTDAINQAWENLIP